VHCGSQTPVFSVLAYIALGLRCAPRRTEIDGTIHA
jgi:hypothetical protein